MLMKFAGKPKERLKTHLIKSNSKLKVHTNKYHYEYTLKNKHTQLGLVSICPTKHQPNEQSEHVAKAVEDYQKKLVSNNKIAFC